VNFSGFRLRNFKSLHRWTDITFADLTVLAGTNSGGKSAVMQPLLLMKQTLESPYDPGPLLLDGPHVSLHRADHVLSRGKSAKSSASFFEIAFLGTGGQETLCARYSRDPNQAFRMHSMVITRDGQRFVFKEGAAPDNISDFLLDDFPIHLMKESDGDDWSVTRDRCFLNLSLSRDGMRYFEMPIASRLVHTIRRMIHLPGLRGNPERAYKATAVESTYPGLFQDYIASIILSWEREGDGRLQALGRDMKKLGLTWKIHAEPVNDTRVSLRVGRVPSGQQGGAWDLVDISDVGLGVSQTLPVLVALHAATVGQMVYIEQPELHLHPRAQWHLAEVMVEAVARGLRLVIETHSSVLLRGLQTHIARGELDKSALALHWFSRDSNGFTKVSTGLVDAHGAFTDWPEDLDDAAFEADTAYLNAVARAGRSE
jgi:hypothetical protein